MKIVGDHQAELFKDLAKARALLVEPKQSAKVNYGGRGAKYSYAPLNSVTKAINDAIKETGLFYSQEENIEGANAKVTTFIFHSGGSYIEFEPLSMPVTTRSGSPTPQDYGSAFTYARRYSLSAAFGLATEADDDANNLSRNSYAQGYPQAQAQNKPTPQMQKSRVLSDKELSQYKVTFEGKKALMSDIYKEALDGNSNAGVFLKKLTNAQDKQAFKQINQQYQDLQKALKQVEAQSEAKKEAPKPVTKVEPKQETTQPKEAHFEDISLDDLASNAG